MIPDKEWFGKEVVITGEVKYIGEGLNPADDPIFQVWTRACREVYSKEKQQPTQ